MNKDKKEFIEKFCFIRKGIDTKTLKEVDIPHFKDIDPQLVINWIEKKKVGWQREAHIQSIGWVCPKCGAGNSPYSSKCNCVPHKFEITCTS